MRGSDSDNTSSAYAEYLVLAAASDAQLQALLGRRGSNAAGTHEDRRTRRNRDRSAQRRNAITDQDDK